MNYQKRHQSKAAEVATENKAAANPKLDEAKLALEAAQADLDNLNKSHEEIKTKAAEPDLEAEVLNELMEASEEIEKQIKDATKALAKAQKNFDKLSE